MTQEGPPGRSPTPKMAPGPIPEGDRLGVLLAGFRQWLREPLDLSSEDRLTLPDTLDSLVTQRYDVVRDGLRTQLG